ncbi:MAG: cytosine permease [Candidatus Dormibacteria bacterium]
MSAVSAPVEPEAFVPVREGVYGDRVAAIEPGGVEYIADSERHGKARSLFYAWTSPNLEFATVFIGVLPIAIFGGGFGLTLLGLALGTLLGSLSHGVLSTFGSRYGVPQLVQSRASFGFWGNLLPAALNAITSGAGWVAVNSVSGAFALVTFTKLVGHGVPQPSYLVALAVIVAIELAVAFFGYNMVHGFERVVFPVIGIIFLLCTIQIFANSHLGTGFNAKAPAAAGGQLGAFILAVYLAFSYSASWNPYAADYSRYLPRATSPRAIAVAAASGMFVSCLLLEAAGAAAATVAKTNWVSGNPTDQFVIPLDHRLAIVATLAIAVGAVAANILNIYSGALSFLSLGITIPGRYRRAITAALSGVVGFAIAANSANGPGSKYESFLLLNTYWIVPFLAVVLVDYVRRRGAYAQAEFFDRARPIWQGVTAMVAGILLSTPFWNNSPLDGFAHVVGVVAKNQPQLGDISCLVGAVVSAAVYALLPRPRPYQPAESKATAQPAAVTTA